MIDVMHISDIHTDHSLDQANKCCNFALAQASERVPDLIVIAGDIYNSQHVKLDSEACRFVFEWVQSLSTIAPVFIVKGTPSHEGYAISPLQHINSKYKVIVADMPGMYYMVEGGAIYAIPHGKSLNVGPAKALISAMPTPTKEMIVQAGQNIQAENDTLANALTPIFANFGQIAADNPGIPHIHVGHYCVRGAAISETQVMIGRDIEIGKDQLMMANVDLGCLGHIHLHQELFDRWYYSGSLIRKNQGEYEDKGFYFHRIVDDKSLSSEFVPAPARNMLRIREDFTKTDLADLDMVLHTFSPEELKDAHLKIEFKVWVDEGLDVTKAKILDFYKDCGCADIKVEITRVKKQNIRSNEVVKADRLSDKVNLMAVQNNEEISAGVLEKCELLETKTRDEIIEGLKEVKKEAEPETFETVDVLHDPIVEPEQVQEYQQGMLF